MHQLEKEPQISEDTYSLVQLITTFFRKIHLFPGKNEKLDDQWRILAEEMEPDVIAEFERGNAEVAQFHTQMEKGLKNTDK